MQKYALKVPKGHRPLRGMPELWSADIKNETFLKACKQQKPHQDERRCEGREKTPGAHKKMSSPRGPLWTAQCYRQPVGAAWLSEEKAEKMAGVRPTGRPCAQAAPEARLSTVIRHHRVPGLSGETSQCHPQSELRTHVPTRVHADSRTCTPW